MADSENASEHQTKHKDHGERKFYDIDFSQRTKKEETGQESNPEKLLEYVDSNIIGKDYTFHGPFGRRQVVYLDYTASGKSLSFIEDYIRDEVLPCYGNTHTTTSVTSLQTTMYRHEAKDIIRNAVNAGEHDAVIFAGSGSTSAVHKLIHGLNVQKAPIVFVGPFEHHTNLLPWREIAFKVVRIGQTKDGLLDLNALCMQLEQHQSSARLLISSFSAASNVTGIITETDAVSALCHRYGSLVFWDYAACAPYIDMDMNPVVAGADQGLVYKDAIFFSMHKFVGGVQAPGVIVAKKKLFRNPVPLETGGGTVFYVTRTEHTYLKDTETREEGGTPAIVESIRAGMVMQLKQAITPDVIMMREHLLHRKAMSSWRNCSNLVLLGNLDVPRIAIFSFLVRQPQLGTFLHYNFICAVLNDVFGIQARGGCACAGPYVQDLLGCDEELTDVVEDLLREDERLDRSHLRRKQECGCHREVLRPGFARINIPYFASDECATFVIKAVAMVSENAWKLLPQYRFNPETGEWRHYTEQVFKDRKWLGSISYHTGKLSYPTSAVKSKGPLPSSYEDCMKKAAQIFASAKKLSYKLELGDQLLMFDEAALRVHWFCLPSEAKDLLQGLPPTFRKPAFSPVSYDRQTLEDSREKDPATNIWVIHKNEVGETEQDLNGECQTPQKRTESGDLFTPPASAKSRLEHILDKGFSPPLKEVFSKHPRTHSGWEEDDEHVAVPELEMSAENAADTSDNSMKRIDSEVFEGNKKLRGWVSPPKVIFSAMIEAVSEYSMIGDGDRVLVCLSGGKDSLSLLHALHQYQFYARKQHVRFELGAVTVDPQTPAYNPRPLVSYLAALGVPYFYEEQPIIQQAAALPNGCASICSFCSRMKRGRIYACARQHSYNVLALGQHLDDLTESFLMSVFHNGALRTMKANYTVQEGDLRVIRPFVYVREKHLRHFAERRACLPVIAENCPACFEAPKERHRIKQLLAAQEIMFPRIYKSMATAIAPLMAISKVGVEGKLGQLLKEAAAEQLLEGEIEM